MVTVSRLFTHDSRIPVCLGITIDIFDTWQWNPGRCANSYTHFLTYGRVLPVCIGPATDLRMADEFRSVLEQIRGFKSNSCLCGKLVTATDS